MNIEIKLALCGLDGSDPIKPFFVAEMLTQGDLSERRAALAALAHLDQTTATDTLKAMLKLV
jgi:hypothetical protein